MNRVSVQEFWDVDGKLLSEIDYNSIIQADPRPVFDYVYLGGEPVALLTATWDSTGVGPGASVSSGGPLVNGAAYGLHGNHLGATLKATDATQTVVFSAEYEPFGRAVTTGTLNLGSRLPGQFDDLPSTGGPDSFHPIYNGSRIYDSSTGRYLQPESLLQNPSYSTAIAKEGYATPTYAYALNNPVNKIDSLGLDDKSLGALWDKMNARDQALRNLTHNPDVKYPGVSPRTPLQVLPYVWRTAKLLNACNNAANERYKLEAEFKAKREAEEKLNEFKKLLWDKFKIQYTDTGNAQTP